MFFWHILRTKEASKKWINFVTCESRSRSSCRSGWCWGVRFWSISGSLIIVRVALRLNSSAGSISCCDFPDFSEVSIAESIVTWGLTIFLDFSSTVSLSSDVSVTEVSSFSGVCWSLSQSMIFCPSACWNRKTHWVENNFSY